MITGFALVAQRPPPPQPDTNPDHNEPPPV